MAHRIVFPATRATACFRVPTVSTILPAVSAATRRQFVAVPAMKAIDRWVIDRSMATQPRKVGSNRLSETGYRPPPPILLSGLREAKDIRGFACEPPLQSG